MGIDRINNNIESREPVINASIEKLEVEEGMEAGFILADIIMFAPVEGNEAMNLEYLAEMAEKLGITVEEMHAYAILKAQEYQE